MVSRTTRMPNRRQALWMGAGAIGAVALGGSVSAASDGNGAEERVMQFTGGRRPPWGKIKLHLPQIAPTGSTIPMAVSVESPMTETTHVTDLLVVADRNSDAEVATFRFSPASGTADVLTRIRLESSQNVVAVARMSDGSFCMCSRYVRVAIGGCGC